MDYVTILGFVAGTLTTIAFLPQVIQIRRTKSAKDISLGMYVILVVGIFLWFLYGVFTRDLPISVVNTVSLTLASTVLALKIKYK